MWCFYFVRWQYLGRVQVLSQWVFTWWSRAANRCLNRPSCRVCPSPSLWRPGEELRVDTGYWCTGLKIQNMVDLKSFQNQNQGYLCFLELLLYSNLAGILPARSQTTTSCTVILFFCVSFPDTMPWSWGKTLLNRPTALWATSSACCLSLHRLSWPPRWKQVGRHKHQPTLTKFRAPLRAAHIVT